jgi:hypothetical protein
MLVGAKYVLHCAVHMLWYWEMTVLIVELLRYWPEGEDLGETAQK